jgi:hypothetical protein
VTVIALGILAFMVIVLIGAIVLVTVTFSRTLQKSLDNADRVHERSNKQVGSVLDRLMAKDFEDFKVYDLGERDGVTGSVEVPQDGEDRPWQAPAVVLPGRGLAGGDKILEEVED